MLLLGGLAFRRVAAALAHSAGDESPAPALVQLPLHMGNWTGRDVPLGESLLQAAGVETHVYRTYTSPAAAGTVSLFVGYGVRPRDLVPHRPGVCYPGAGWRLESEQLTDVRLPDGSALPCNIFRFSRGGVGAHEITVLNYYRIDGQHYPDVGYLRRNAWAGGRVRYVAQVQIACADVPPDAAQRIVGEFAVEAASRISELLPGRTDTSQ